MMKRTRTCALDYLLGTLATAYRGLVTTLVIKDFCISVEAGRSVLNGTLLSMPRGEYEVSLISSGRELARGGMEDGYFELEVPSAVVEEAENLQLDVIQRGRHIGTFLLKKTAGGGAYSSALELSEELRWLDLKTLNDMLKEHRGLQQAGEKIIASVLSTKKDWRKLSGEIGRFARDLFWYERRAFYMWFELLSRFSLKAALLSADSFGDKTVADCLTLLELPLREEEDAERARHAAAAWVRELGANPVNLSYRYRQVIDVVGLMNERLPAVDAAPVMARLVESLKGTGFPAIRDDVLEALAGRVSKEDGGRLRPYAESRRRQVLESLEAAERVLAGEGDAASALEIMRGVDASTFDGRAMVEAFADALERGLGSVPGPELSLVLGEFFGLAGEVSKEAEDALVSGAARIFRRALDGRITEAAAAMLDIVRRGGDRLKDMLLNAEVAGAVMGSGEQGLVEAYRDMLKGMRIPPPRIAGFSDETWAELANPLHLKRLRGFMEVLRSGEVAGMKDVLVHLIACLNISGVFIPDDRLFQREVSVFLNSDWPKEDFLLSYLFLKKLPVYFGEVGASGRIRDCTTELDAWGNDPVIYFLRKQVHVNASSRNIRLVEEVIRSWVLNDPGPLRGVVPAEVLENFDAALLGRYHQVIVPLFESLGALEDGRLRLERLASATDDEVESRITGAGDEEGSKVRNICRIYKEVKAKYALSPARTGREAPSARELVSYVSELEKLRETVLSPARTEPREDLYFKRHIAFGIPSVIGTYSEPKFDAYSRGLRVQEAARVLLEETVSEVEEQHREFTFADFESWRGVLEQVNAIFRLNGLCNAHVDEVAALLSAGGLHLSQVIDLLRIWQKELTWWVETFYRTFHVPVINALALYPGEEFPERLGRLGLGGEGFEDKAADILVRDVVNTVAGFDELDRMLNAVIKVLSYRVETAEDILIGGEIRDEAGFHVIDEMEAEDAERLAPVLGGKAANLVRLKRAGLPVPPAAVFSAARTREWGEYTQSAEFRASLEEAVGVIEEKTGLRFGAGRGPLFLSVRSGSYISMPGILDSILYCGMNDSTCAALEREAGGPWFAWDSRRRFVEHYASVVHGVEGPLEEVLSVALRGRGAGDVQGLDAGALEEVVRGYLAALSRMGHAIPDEPFAQLEEAVRAVYRSWYRARAMEFRRAMGVSEHWGTAVTVMAMLYANRQGAGSSVFFTRNPLTLEAGVYGETRERATGDDLVSGKAPGRPISKVQGVGSLEETDPGLYILHEETARRVERAMGGLPQEVEAAYFRETGVIHVLQTRRMELRKRRDEKFHDACRLESNRIGRGIGVHGGALTGVATFARSAGEVRALKERLEEPVILIRRETSTADVSLMSEVDGILTAVGGASSHAAILAQKFDLDAVVGCPEMEVSSGAEGPYAQIGGYTVMEGSPLSIDGSNGLVYSGVCAFLPPGEGQP